MKTSIYLIGSLRNTKIPAIGKQLRTCGYDVFDDWYGAGHEADDMWQSYEEIRGRGYAEALDGHAAGNIFEFDKHHIDRCDVGLLVLPAGKSGHLELGYMVGSGKECFVLFPEEPERWDVMYRFAKGVFFDLDELTKELKRRFPK